MDILILLIRRILIYEKWFYILSLPILGIITVLLVNHYVLDHFMLYVLEVDGKEFKYVRVHFSLFRRRIVIFVPNEDVEIMYYSHIVIKNWYYGGNRKRLRLLKEFEEKGNSFLGEKGDCN